LYKRNGPHKETNTVKIKEEIIFLSISGISNLSHLISILRYIIAIYVRHVFQNLFFTCENTNV